MADSLHFIFDPGVDFGINPVTLVDGALLVVERPQKGYERVGVTSELRDLVFAHVYTRDDYGLILHSLGDEGHDSG